MKSLLVDDETAILDALEILFRGEGYEVAVADSGPKALAALEDEKPDIVLTDIRMPGAGGLEVLTQAREVDPEMAVILMTAQASLQSAVRAVNEGAYYYLQSPSRTTNYSRSAAGPSRHASSRWRTKGSRGKFVAARTRGPIGRSVGRLVS